jgi:hypothetical protein
MIGIRGAKSAVASTLTSHGLNGGNLEMLERLEGKIEYFKEIAFTR